MARDARAAGAHARRRSRWPALIARGHGRRSNSSRPNTRAAVLEEERHQPELRRRELDRPIVGPQTMTRFVQHQRTRGQLIRPRADRRTAQTCVDPRDELYAIEWNREAVVHTELERIEGVAAPTQRTVMRCVPPADSVPNGASCKFRRAATRRKSLRPAGSTAINNPPLVCGSHRMFFASSASGLTLWP